jgi:catechol 2,3-dioxygenase-like lactoylglutathione lyase family enzyme
VSDRYDPDELEDLESLLAEELGEMPSADREEIQRSPHLAYTILYTADVEELSEFYEGAFLFSRRYETASVVELQAGAVILSICEGAHLQEQAGVRGQVTPGAAGVSLTFLVEDVDGVVEAAIALGAELLRAPHETDWGMRSAWLRDPAGHVIEVGRWLR